MDNGGYRVAAAGLITTDGAGNVTNIALDINVNGRVQTVTGLSGSYSLAPNAPGGRGSGQTVIGDAVAANYALYVVSPSDFFIIGTDPADASHSIFGGEGKLQTGPFSTSMLAGGSGYVLYISGIDAGNGGSVTILGQAQITTNTGVATVTLDFNARDIGGTLGSSQGTFTVDSSGRMTVTGEGHPPVFYLVDSTQGFVVGTNLNVDFGYIQQQTLSSFSASTISGRFFFGGGAATIGGQFESGTVNFSPGTPSGTITGTGDESRPNFLLFCMQDCGGGGGLQPNNSFSAPYAFPAAPVAPGQFCLAGDCPGDGLLGYIISPTKIVLMQTGTAANPNPPEIAILQK